MNMFKKMLCLGAGALALVGAAQGQVVISQVYGGGGNSGALYRNDFIELFNKGTTAVNIAGWSVQYASAAGTSWTVTNIGTGAVTSLAPGQYYLVQEAQGSGGSANLPTPDATGTIAMSGTAGKVALVSSTTALTGACPTGGTVIDLVGFGATASCFEGSGPTPAPSNTQSVARANGGCTDNNNNAGDFNVTTLDGSTSLPRNSASPTNVCQSATPPTGSGSATPASACPSASIDLTFTVTPGSPANPIASVVGDGSSIGAGTINFVNSSGNTWNATGVMIASSITTGPKTIPVTINEVGGRTGSGTIGVTINNCTLGLTTGTGFSPETVCLGTPVTFTAVVRKNQIGTTSTGITATLDLTFLGGGQVPMTDLGDDPNNANLRDFSLTYTVPQSAGAGMQLVTVNIADAQGNTVNGSYTVPTVTCVSSTSDVVISQVYGGGGATSGTPTYKVDYVELFNRSSAPVTMTDWALQYSSSTGTGAWSVSSPFSGTIPAGGYYLVSFTQAAGSIGADLPAAADATPATALNMSATNGKVALTTDATALTGQLPTGPTIKDLVGYGSANGYEGASAAPALTNTLADFRRSNGCQDFDQNGADFLAATPAPRTSASPLNNCAGGPTGVCCRGATCNTTVAQASCNTSGATAGAHFVSSAASCNSGPTSNTPCCTADYNKTGGVSVQDIFDFLADWFAGSPYANTGGNGTPGALNVQNIFDFLSAWFAGGC